MDIQGTIDKLMAIEKVPVTNLQNKVKELGTEKAALQGITAQLLALKLSATPFKSGVTFRPNIASSSNENALTASANSNAVPGQYTFNVLQTAQTHQLVSQGFNDADQTPVGQGTVSIEMGQGKLDRDQDLNFLRNQQGIRKGTIRITDRTGASADIDLSHAVSVSDVLKAINGAGLGVTADVSGDHFVIKDTSGSSAHNLVVQDLNGGGVAADLGLVKNTSDTQIAGSDLIGVTVNTALKYLNDGNGIRSSGLGSDLKFTLRDGTEFNADLNSVTLDSSLSLLNNGKGIRAGKIKITNKAGAFATVDLTSAKTVQDVMTAIGNSGLNVTPVLYGGTKFLITDGSTGTNKLKIESVDNSGTAADLGIETEVDGSSFTGKEIFRLSTLGDVKRVIEDAAHRAGNPDKLTVNISPDGKGISLSDTTGGAGDLVVSSTNDSLTAEDLGINGTFSASTVTGKRMVSGLNTVLLKNLNGGTGVGLGTIEIQNRAGQTKLVNLSGAATLQDVLDAINNTSGIGVKASLNDAHTGIVLKDQTGASAVNLKISDLDSTTAHDLHIEIDSAVSQVDTGNNQLKYISETTLLSQLNGGNGISAGGFSLTDSMGGKYTLSLSSTEVGQKSIGDLISIINGQSMAKVHASINSTGDGILMTDTAGGAGQMSIANQGSGTTASDLNIAGQANIPGAGSIDGSFEYKITLGGSDTLQNLADKINKLKGPFTAAVVSDGTGTNSYHLTLTSKYSGKSGALVINGGQTGLNLSDLVEGRDAIISLGGTAGGNSLVATSSSNTFKNLVSGVILTAKGASSSPVTVSISQDVDTVTEKVKAFVDKFNAIIGAISDATKYDTTTQTGGTLFGNYQVETVQTRLYSFISSTFSGVGSITNFSALGITVGSDGNLSMDTEKFKTAYAGNSKAIETFFSTTDKGAGYVLDKLTDDYTRSIDGVLTTAVTSYDSRTKLLNDRITYMQSLLTSKENRLYRQFQNMETALAKLQTMQTAISSLSTISTTSNSSSSSSSA
jgi:flagellar hook-associated protein 2